MESKLKDAKLYLYALTIEELKELLRLYNVKKYSKLKKEKIIELLINSIPSKDFNDFLLKIQNKSYYEIISIIPKYFKVDNPTRLNKLIFDKKNKVLNLSFKGFSWEIHTRLELLNLNKKSENLKYKLQCDCEYAEKGGLCSHFWTAIAWLLQNNLIKTKRWNKGNFPEILVRIYPSLNFNPFYKESIDDIEERNNIETILKIKLMGKTDFNYDDLEDLSISEIKEFLDDINLIDDDILKKSKKSFFIEYIKENLYEKKFKNFFFEFKKSLRLSEARKIPIEIKDLKWGPPLNCLCEIKITENNVTKEYQIIIKNDKILHENCHWIYHRQNFCGHIIALVLFLSKMNYQKTFDFLKSYVDSL